MKKISAFIVMFLCVIIGGVYAAWTYTQGDSRVGLRDKDLSGPSLTQQTSSTSYGEYLIETTNLNFSIDQAKEAGEDYHKAKLLIPDNATLLIIFKPSPEAPNDIKNNGVATWFKFAEVNSMTFKADEYGNYNEGAAARAIFTYQTVAKIDRVDAASGAKWVKNESTGYLEYELKATALRAAIKLGQFRLDTPEVYTKFHDAISGKTITIFVCDKENFTSAS